DRALDEVVHPVPIRRQALPPARAGRGGVGAEGLRAEVVADFGRRRPARLQAAVGRRWVLDHHVLVHAQSRRVAIAERDVDRAVGPDDGMRALVLITRVRIGLAAECRACASVATADLDACRPRRTTVSRLAEVYRAVAWNTRGRTAGCVEPCPRGVDAVLRRTRIARIGDD